jgi:Ca2+-transporting ATPase
VSFVVWYEVRDLSLDEARTMAFVTLIFAELLKSLGSRSLYRTLFAMGPLANPYLIVGVSISLLALLGVLFVPPLADAFDIKVPGVEGWLLVIGLSLIPLLIIEALKVSPWRLRPYE